MSSQKTRHFQLPWLERTGYNAAGSGQGTFMFRAFVAACLLQAAIISSALAAGPYGSIKIGGWVGGAFTDDKTGAFSHCAATTAYASGIILVIGQNSANSWLLGF